MDKKFANLLLILLVVYFGGCSPPIQGYPGPKLPPEQTSLIRRLEHHNLQSSTHIGKGQYDQYVDRGGIEVLPGKYTLTVTRSEHSTPYECTSNSTFHLSLLDNCNMSNILCEANRNKSGGSGNCTPCSREQFTTVITKCTEDYWDISCTGEIELLPGHEYVPGYTDEGKYVIVESDGNTVANITCLNGALQKRPTETTTGPK